MTYIWAGNYNKCILIHLVHFSTHNSVLLLLFLSFTCSIYRSVDQHTTDVYPISGSYNKLLQVHNHTDSHTEEFCSVCVYNLNAIKIISE